MIQHQVFLTVDGKKKMEIRLDELKNVLRPAAAKRVGIAREFGDLSENSEYDAAKDEQAAVEAEITDLENKLLLAQVIQRNTIDTSKVTLGCFVKLFDEEFDDSFEYQIVGTCESDPKKGLISNESPVGRTLLGKKKGDVVTVETPSGRASYKIMGIRA